MKIMYILHESGDSFNGASRSALSLIKNAVEANNDVYVVLPLKEGKLVEELNKLCHVKIIEEKYFRWKRVKSNRKEKRVLDYIKYHTYENLKNIKIAKKISKYIVDEQIDIIHTNSSVVNIGGLIHQYTKIPHVWHVREFGEEDFDMYPLSSEKNFYKFMYKNSTAIVCISEAIANKVSRYMPKDKIKVIYNGIEIPDLEPKKQFLNNLLISGMISKKKGQWVAVEAVNILKDRGIDVTLYIAGKGEDANLGKYYVSNKDRIKKLGFVNDMKEVRSKMDIELMCSVSEGFGRTIIEGMASGLIVIAAAGGAAPELIKDGKNGFLFGVNEPEQLANIIQRVNKLTDEEKNNVRNKSYIEAKNKFSEKKYVENIRNLYIKLLAEEK